MKIYLKFSKKISDKDYWAHKQALRRRFDYDIYQQEIGFCRYRCYTDYIHNYQDSFTVYLSVYDLTHKAELYAVKLTHIGKID